MDDMPEHSGAAVATDGRRGTAAEVLLVFLRLGLTSFGGPIAHLGYFREEFVVRRHWLDEQAYVDLVALCQFLPGPASSQVGFSIGLMRAGCLGGWRRGPASRCRRRLLIVLFAYGAGALIGAGRRRPAAWAEARRGRDRGAGGLGHGAHAVPGPGARLDRVRGGAGHSVRTSSVAQIGGDRAGRHRRPVAVPRRAAAVGGTLADAGLAHAPGLAR